MAVTVPGAGVLGANVRPAQHRLGSYMQKAHSVTAVGFPAANNVVTVQARSPHFLGWHLHVFQG